MSEGPLGALGPLVRMSAALAARSDAGLAEAFDELRGADPLAVDEALLQGYLFVGYPATLNAFALWRERSGHPSPDATPDDWERWIREGGGVCARVYGDRYQALRENVRALHPDLERWMVAEGYGKVLARPGLELADRELCIVAMLVVLDAPRQLYSHARGALRTGATAAQADAAIAEAGKWATPAALDRARVVWDRVRAAAPDEEEDEGNRGDR